MTPVDKQQQTTFPVYMQGVAYISGSTAQGSTPRVVRGNRADDNLLEKSCGWITGDRRDIGNRTIVPRHATVLPGQRQLLERVRSAVLTVDIPHRDASMAKCVRCALQALDNALIDGDWNESLYTDAVQTLLNYLVQSPKLPENLGVINQLAACGFGMALDTCIGGRDLLPAELMALLFRNTDVDVAQTLLGNSGTYMLYQQDPLYLELLEKYLPEPVLDRLVFEFCKRNFYDRYQYVKKLSKGAFQRLLPALVVRIDAQCAKVSLPQNGSSTFPGLLENRKLFKLLSLLELNAFHCEGVVSEFLSDLGRSKQARLQKVAAALGHRQLFQLLGDLVGENNRVLLDNDPSCGNFLHFLAAAMSSAEVRDHRPFADLGVCKPGYDQILADVDLSEMTAQRNKSGHTPLTLFYLTNLQAIAQKKMYGKDENFVAARRDLLIKQTSPVLVPDAMSVLMSPRFPRNCSWLREFILLFSAMRPEDRQQLGALTAAEISTESYTLRNLQIDCEEHFSALAGVVRQFREHPNLLENPDKLVRLILSMRERLPVEYPAMLLAQLKPPLQREVVTALLNRAELQVDLFTERRFMLFYNEIHHYPWYLFALGLGSDCAPADNSRLVQLFDQVIIEHQNACAKLNIPVLPDTLMADFSCSSNREVYGRSVAFRCAEVASGYRRFKFLKRKHSVTECWNAFIREQVQLQFFRAAKEELGLESALIKPRGIYRLSDAVVKLTRLNLPDSLLNSIAIEADGSAYLQVFDDEPNSVLYHHYPYDVFGKLGLSLEASFEGIQLFARDAGRLWRQGFQSPDTLSTFHNASDGRGWVPTPFFGGQGVPGTLGEWSAQDYPNISPFPVGMRDWADVRTFTERQTVTFGMRDELNATLPQVQKQMKVTELGRVWYGLVINWLRVLHDTRQLDYQNPGQMELLKQQLVTTATNLFGYAFVIDPKVLLAEISVHFPDDALNRMVLECGYYCDPDYRYVDDMRNDRFSDKIYPDHPTRDLNRVHIDHEKKCLADTGFTRSSRARTANLGIDSGTMPLLHIDSLFWFCMVTGWQKVVAEADSS